MGGSNSFFNKPLGSVGDDILGKDLAGLGNMVASWHMGNPLPTVKNIGRETGKGVAELTGSAGMQRQMERQAKEAAEAAKQQATAANLQAAAQGGRQTRISSNAGRRRNQGSGGGSGFGSNMNLQRGTGVQS